MADASAAGRAIVATCSDAALAYAWCKVCFTAWDACLDSAGEKILRYSQWPSFLRSLLAAVYPAYFVYSSTKRLSGPDGPSRPTELRRWVLLLSLCCSAAGILGLKHGRALRDRSTATKV